MTSTKPKNFFRGGFEVSMTNTKTQSKEMLMGFELEVKELHWKCIGNIIESNS